MLLTFAQMIFVPPKWGGSELPVHFTLPPPSLLGLFFFLITLTFVFSISISCLNQTWRTCSLCCSKGRVHTCLYRDVHRCDTNQWFDTNVTLFNPVFFLLPFATGNRFPQKPFPPSERPSVDFCHSPSLLSLSAGLFSGVEFFFLLFQRYLLMAPGRTMCPDLVPQWQLTFICPKNGINVSGSESPLPSTWRMSQNSTCTYFERIPQCKCSDILNV